MIIPTVEKGFIPKPGQASLVDIKFCKDPDLHGRKHVNMIDFYWLEKIYWRDVRERERERLPTNKPLTPLLHGEKLTGGWDLSDYL